ncbi:GNAT family N-acetyltransferase [soil metagenome]
MEKFLQQDYMISTDKTKLDVALLHRHLAQAYWSKSIPRDVVEKAIENSLCFGVYHQAKQVGFARVISDFASFAYLADVFVVEEHRGRGLSKWLVAVIMGHPELQGLRRWLLITRDAHGLYSQFGFQNIGNPERVMEIARPNLYLDPTII